MYKKVLFFLLLPLLAELVLSCCDCPDTVTLHYTNRTMLVKNLDNRGSGPVVAASNTVPKAAYGIRIELVREKTAALRKSLFLPAAYAFSCGCPPPMEIRPGDSITALQVFTVRDFDASHAAGSDISAYFKGYNPYYFLSIPDYLEKWGTLLYNESELLTKVDLLLMTPPAVTGVHQFRVRLTLSDGRVLEQDTPTIELV
jgi:hypothetical protein